MPPKLIAIMFDKSLRGREECTNWLMSNDLFFDFCLACEDNYSFYNFYAHRCNVSNGVRLIDNSKGIYFVFAK